MTHAALAPLIGPEFDEFLGALIGEDRNGTGLSVLSALARLDGDPWQEAASLARKSREAAAGRLTVLIAALPYVQASAVLSKTIAADLIALLPRASKLSVRSPDSEFAVVGARQAQIRIASCALIALIVIVLALLASHSPGSEPMPSHPPLSPPTPRWFCRLVLRVRFQRTGDRSRDGSESAWSAGKFCHSKETAPLRGRNPLKSLGAKWRYFSGSFVFNALNATLRRWFSARPVRRQKLHWAVACLCSSRAS
jgi:hypothetical protein